MKRQPRLSRSQVLARLRAHGARHGSVSPASLGKHDRIVLRSLHLYFANFDAARRAARVAAPARRARGKRRGRTAVWSRRRVIDELRRLDRGGKSTTWADLRQAGRGDLVGAAVSYAGGLGQARIAARLAPPARRAPVPRWNRATIVVAIKDRRRKRQTLASSKAPQHLVAAARWHFGSWEAALAAAGVDASGVRLQRRPYTKQEIVALLRRLARQGTAIRASTLEGVVKVDTVRKMFGSVADAVRAAGIAHVASHANQKWSRERVIEELRARARRGDATLTRGLHRAVQLYFGGAHAAREAAGVPLLLRAPWTKASLIAELRRRARRGDAGAALWNAGKRLFGSMAAARRAAGVPAAQRATGMAAWGKRELIAELRRRIRKRQQLGRGLTEGLRRQFGSLGAARARAGVSGRRPARKRRATSWTPSRIRRALRQPGFEADPAFVAACIAAFGSVTAARTAARRRSWSKAAVIAELRARSRRGLRGVGRLVREPAVRLFGSAEAALRAARAEGAGDAM